MRIRLTFVCKMEPSELPKRIRLPILLVMKLLTSLKESLTLPLVIYLASSAATESGNLR